MFTPERLLLARQWRGLTQSRLAEQMGCSKSHVEKMERGDTSPSDDVKTALARVLEFPVEFFEAPPPNEIPVSRVSFRALTKMTARERDAALAVGSLASAFSDWIDTRFELPQPSLPDLSGLAPQQAAENMRAAWGLGDTPISNVVHLLELHGVRVFSLSQDTRDVDAYSFFNRERPFVFLNTTKSAERSRFDAAHELGHLVLHRQREPDGRVLEDEANDFASAFLMPQLGMMARKVRGFATPDLVKGKRFWGVSLVAYAYRLQALGLLSQWHYKKLCIEFSSLGYRTKEPSPMPRETSQVLGKVLHQLRAQGIGKADVARHLAIRPRDLDQMVFGLVLAALG